MSKQADEKHIDPRYKIGMRNVKTALSVGVCLLFFQFIGVGDGIQAAIAAIICMKSSLQNSIQTGIERVIGTAIGSTLGVMSLLIIEKISFQVSTLLAITGIILIIYLCNIFKVQASIVIGLVVFLIILIGEKDVPPIQYGIVRLAETIFGIITAYVINRFFDPRHIRKLIKKPGDPTPEIREINPGELGRIMSIWLRSNLAAHPFIDASYWHDIYDSVRSRYHNSLQIFAYETNGQIIGFISVDEEGKIDGLHVDEKNQNQGIEESLLEYCQELFPSLTIKIYSNNEKFAEILLKTGFVITDESTDSNVNAEQYTMVRSHKSA